MNITSRGKYRASLIYYLFSVFSFSDPCCGIVLRRAFAFRRGTLY